MTKPFHPRTDVLVHASFVSLGWALLVCAAGVSLELWPPDNPGIGHLVSAALAVPLALWLIAALGDSMAHIEWLSARSGAWLVGIGVAGAQVVIGSLHALGVAMLATVVLSVFALLLR